MAFLGPQITARHALPRHIAWVSAAVILLFTLYILAPRSAGINVSSLSKGARPSSNTVPPGSSKGGEHQSRLRPDDNDRASNATLGFSKVFVIGLPERSDKHDAIALSSALTGFHVEWVDGVRGEDIPDKAIPFGITRERLWNTNLGSWRGHMNAVRRIVEEDLDSALIMEDDMDWDTRLKSQLPTIARGIKQLLPSPDSRPSSSPYGSDWDLLWLGHCGEVFPELLDENKEKPPTDMGIQYMSRKFVIPNDPTVPDLDKVTGIIDFKKHPAHTRFVHITGAPICTFAYALSNRGARKVLFDLSVDHLTAPFDNALAGLCRRSVSSYGVDDPVLAGDHGLDTKCISVTPPIFFHHKAKGAINADSDIQTVANGEIREHGTTENIVWSARNNLRNTIMGTKMESE